MTEDFPVPEGGADAVLAAGRARRIRRATLAGAGALLLIAVPIVSAGLLRDGGSDSLTAREPRPTQRPTLAAPTASRTPDTRPTPGRSAVPTSGTRPTGRPSPTRAVPSGSTRPTPVTDPPAAASYSPRGSAPAPITRGTSRIETTDLCDDGQTDPTRVWCARYTGPTTAKRGQQVVLSFELCRYREGGDTTVTFRSAREIDATVTSGERRLWQAGQGYAYAQVQRREVVKGGACLVWSSPWDTRDQEGFLVVPGSYQFTGYVDSDEALPGASGTLEIIG